MVFFLIRNIQDFFYSEVLTTWNFIHSNIFIVIPHRVRIVKLVAYYESA